VARVVIEIVVELVVAAAASVALSACSEPVPAGTSGVRGKVVFQAPTELAWSERLAVGSVFDVTAVARAKKNALGDAATVDSSDADVAVVDDVSVADGALHCRVTIAGPGQSDLKVVADGAEVDHIRLQAARAVTTTLVDAALVDAAVAVDPGLPEHFAVVADATTRVLVSASDACGGALLDLGASSVVVDAPEGVDPATLASVTADGAAAFVIEPAVASALRLQLQSPGLEPLDWDVDAVARSAIDEVKPQAASADGNAGSVTLWGRAFVDDVEVVGVDFSWTASERVSLSTPTGAATTATISFPTADQPPDDRAATVTAELVGEEGTIDLLALTDTSLVTARAAAPTRADDTANDDDAASDAVFSCGGGKTCDPLAALLPCVPFVGLRRRRRRGLRR
jgi:hypothetical protein